MPSGEEIQEIIHPDRTIQEILLKVQCKAKLTGKQFALYLQPVKGSKMLLENNRTLRSYRVSPTDKFELIDRNTQKGSKLKQDQMLFLKVSCPEFNCERTLKLKSTATIGEVIYRFSKKVNGMTDVANYGLHPASSYKQLDVKKRLTDYRIPNMAQMTLKKFNGPPNEIYQEKQIFGVDPSQMTLVQADSGKYIYLKN